MQTRKSVGGYYEEILKAQGVTDEQIKAIQTSMKENRVYETSLENADERYNKLKLKRMI